MNSKSELIQKRKRKKLGYALFKRKIDLLKKPKIDSECPSNCGKCNWIEIDKVQFCQSCEFFISRRNHMIDKKVLRQDKNFSTRLPYDNKKVGEFYFSMV